MGLRATRSGLDKREKRRGFRYGLANQGTGALGAELGQLSSEELKKIIAPMFKL